MPVPPGGDAVQPLHPDHRGSTSSHTPCFRKYLFVFFALLGDRFRARHGEPHLPDAAGAEPPQQRPGKVQVLRRRSRKKKKRIRVERIRGFPPRPIMIRSTTRRYCISPSTQHCPFEYHAMYTAVLHDTYLRRKIYRYIRHQNLHGHNLRAAVTPAFSISSCRE